MHNIACFYTNLILLLKKAKKITKKKYISVNFLMRGEGGPLS